MDRYSLLSLINSGLHTEQQLAFYVCQASYEINYGDESGYYDDWGITPKDYPYKWKEKNRSLHLKKWFDVNGNCAFNKSAKFDPDHFTKIYAWSPDTCEAISLKEKKNWGKHVKENVFGCAGYEGVDKITTYSKYVLVMWPRQCEFDSIVGFGLNYLLDLFFNSFVKENQIVDIKSNEELSRIINLFETKRNQMKTMQQNRGRFEYEPEIFNDNQVVMFYQLLQKFNDPQLVEKFLINLKKTEISLKNSLDLAKLVVQFGHERLDSYLKYIFSQNQPKEKIVPICNFVLVRSKLYFHNLIIIFK